MFWGDYVVTVAYLINQMPSRIHDGKTLFELLFWKHLDIHHLRVSGCLCYFSTIGPWDKLGSRALKCIFMGYPALQKGYLVYDQSTGRFFVSGDIIFREDIFPFQMSYLHIRPLITIPF